MELPHGRVYTSETIHAKTKESLAKPFGYNIQRVVEIVHFDLHVVILDRFGEIAQKPTDLDFRKKCHTS